MMCSQCQICPSLSQGGEHNATYVQLFPNDVITMPDRPLSFPNEVITMPDMPLSNEVIIMLDMPLSFPMM